MPSPIDGSPAFKAGVMAGDVILKGNGADYQRSVMQEIAKAKKKPAEARAVNDRDRRALLSERQRRLDGSWIGAERRLISTELAGRFAGRSIMSVVVRFA